MSKERNYGRPYDPQVEPEYDEIDLYEMGEIIMFGELTDYGESLYEATKEHYYDEKTGKWITI